MKVDGCTMPRQQQGDLPLQTASPGRQSSTERVFEPGTVRHADSRGFLSLLCDYSPGVGDLRHANVGYDLTIERIHENNLDLPQIL